jgi:predicted house-cleaning noncanonical NTP pyrophosphatase (MazG superfamily)
MLNSIKVNGNKVNEVIVVDGELKELIKDRKESILDIIKDPALDRKTSLAVLAEVVDEYLSQQESKKEKLTNKKEKQDSNEVA